VFSVFILLKSLKFHNSHSQSGFHGVKAAQKHFCLHHSIGWSIITMRKENVTSLVTKKYKIFFKVLPSTKLSLPDIQVITSLGIESRLFGHNWNAGHNYGPLLTNCDIVPGATAISQLHKHTLVCLSYYHSLPKTPLSMLITDCHHAGPRLASTPCPSLHPLGSLST